MKKRTCLTIFICSIMVILIIISAVYFLCITDSRPLENDYTWKDVLVTSEETNESNKIILEICNISFTNLIYDKSNKCGEEIEKNWQSYSELHKLLEKLDSYDKIIIQTNNNLETANSLMNVAKLYQAYCRLKISQGKFENAIKALDRINSITRKSLPYANNIITKLTWMGIQRLNVKTAYKIITNENCSNNIKQKLKKEFLPLTSKDIALEKPAIAEYLMLKNIIFNNNNTMQTVAKFFIKKNKTLTDLKKHVDIFLKCFSNVPPDFTDYTIFVKDYKNSPDYFNYIGWIYSKMSLANLDLIAIAFLETQALSDLLYIKTHNNKSNLIYLIDPFTGEKYFYNPKLQKYCSAGPDGNYETNDDIFL